VAGNGQSAGRRAAPAEPELRVQERLPRDFDLWRDAHASREAQKKLRKKAKRLEAMGPLAHRRAADPDEVERFLAAFAAQRRARMRALGIADPYDGAEAQAFLERLALCGLAEGAPRLELHALLLGDRIVAAFGALSAGDRLSGLFISYDSDPEIARSSPGELMVHAVVREAIARASRPSISASARRATRTTPARPKRRCSTAPSPSPRSAASPRSRSS